MGGGVRRKIRISGFAADVTYLPMFANAAKSLDSPSWTDTADLHDTGEICLHSTIFMPSEAV
jgi:hypothetical protein